MAWFSSPEVLSGVGAVPSAPHPASDGLLDGRPIPPKRRRHADSTEWPSVRIGAARPGPPGDRGLREARLRALCAKHGWEFEWKTEEPTGCTHAPAHPGRGGRRWARKEGRREHSNSSRLVFFLLSLWGLPRLPLSLASFALYLVLACGRGGGDFLAVARARVRAYGIPRPAMSHRYAPPHLLRIALECVAQRSA